MLNLTREECQFLLKVLRKSEMEPSIEIKLELHLEVLNAESILDTLTEEAQANEEYNLKEND